MSEQVAGRCQCGASLTADHVCPGGTLTPLKCWICGKEKGQPPERCPGHYEGTDTDPSLYPTTFSFWRTRCLAAEARAEEAEAAARTARDQRNQLVALAHTMRNALQSAREHVLELADAWQTGALSEHDGKGGARSNRNSDVRVELRDALAAYDALLEEK